MLRSTSLSLALALTLPIAGCANPASLGLGHPASRSAGKLPGSAPATAADPHLVPWPSRAPAFIATAGGASVNGQVAFRQVSNPYFNNSAANFRLLSAMPSANAILTLSTLDENLFTLNGAVVTAGSDASGNFALTNQAPADRPYVLDADLVQSHRLSAIVLPGQTSNLVVDEASSAIAEMARWQLQSVQTQANGPYLLQGIASGTLTPGVLAQLQSQTETVLAPGDFAAVGAIPAIAALKMGAGHLLRNLYVGDFGTRVTRAGSSAANTLSDTWKALLGFRPLGFGRVAGNGIAGYNAGNGQPATSVQLLTPIDAVSDEAGNVYETEQDSHLLRYIPASNGPGLLEQTAATTAGSIYTVAGVLNGPTNVNDYNALYRDSGIELGSVATSALAPDASPDLTVRSFALLSPTKLVVAQAGGGHDLYFTSFFGHRVMFIPGQSYPSLFGRKFQAGHLYSLAGTGEIGFNGPPAAGHDAFDYGNQLESGVTASGFDQNRWNYRLGDSDFGFKATLAGPTGLARDTAGNLFILDSQADTNELALSVSDPNQETYVTPNTAVPPDANQPRAIRTYHGTVRVLQASTGKIFSLHLQPDAGTVAALGGAAGWPWKDRTGTKLAWSLEGAKDLRLAPDGLSLYVADTSHHWVLSIPLNGLTSGGSPTSIATMTQNPDPITIVPVLGRPTQPGFINTAAGALYPDIYHAAAGMPASQVLLNTPTSIDFDPLGNPIIADTGNGRIRLLKNGQVYTLAGGLATNYLAGDTRLGFFPGLSYLNVERAAPSVEPNMLVVDRKENVVHRIFTGRGFLEEGP